MTTNAKLSRLALVALIAVLVIAGIAVSSIAVVQGELRGQAGMTGSAAAHSTRSAPDMTREIAASSCTTSGWTSGEREARNSSALTLLRSTARL